MRFEINESERAVAPVSDDSPTGAFRRVAPTRVRVGLVVARDRVDREALARGLGLAIERPIQMIRYAKYTQLAEAVIQGHVDLAWLPPAVYVHVRRTQHVRLVAAVQRSGTDGYRSALLARTGAVQTLDDLRGARAVWVDPWSTAGYLMPRGMIAAQGLDPARALASERFVGSYDAAIDSLVARAAEVTGATCTLDRDGKIIERSWSTAAPVRVLEISPPIPADVFCTTASVSGLEAGRIERALAGPTAQLIASAIGGIGLAPGDPAQHDSLDRAVRLAAAQDELCP